MISGMRTDASRASTDAIAARAAERYRNLRAGIFVLTDRTFAALMLAQWMVAIIVAMVISPYAWEGKATTDYMHVWAAFVVGGILTAPPVALAFLRPASPLTRHWVAVSQMLWSALLIHLTGGRIETHFHAFVSLAVLAFYRDWKVLLTATVVLVSDHVVRGLLWPESLFGVVNPQWWRLLEHGFWAVVCVSLLVLACSRCTRDMRAMAEREAELEALVEERLRDRPSLDAGPQAATA
ncbi:MAG: hypothetical protein ACJ79V_06035 [Myxococcales bacterium]